MKRKLKVYLAGQSNEHDNNWKELFKEMRGIEFHDWEFDSDQTSPDTYFPDDLAGVKKADVLIANPGLAPSEGTWIEVGYFYALNSKKPGDFCGNLIIIWPNKRKPLWSIDFVRKTGVVVSSFGEAKKRLRNILKSQ